MVRVFAGSVIAAVLVVGMVAGCGEADAEPQAVTAPPVADERIRPETSHVLTNSFVPDQETVRLSKGWYRVTVERESHYPLFIVVVPNDGRLGASADEEYLVPVELGEGVLAATAALEVPTSGRYLVTVSGEDFTLRQGEWRVELELLPDA